jgi:GNAT superfamily N-acetyltransferase
MKIRPATLTDMAACLDLVVELAVYERQPEAVTATLEDYERNFLAKTFDVLVAEQDEKVIGMALFYLTWSTWRGRMMYLEDFVVTESARKSGVGQLLFDAFLAKAKAENCVLAKWQVLDWNEPALRFYEKNEAIIEKEWWNGKLFIT